eukprot:CAMPEP_0118823536 /NCGR_PEP_ID=MMETSP1162-20130426/9988_1 /TAXON_ID=33656 /ORGANISM="Phaeocystis Sp, Strain CCMP2710" /LENGTH=97 /DNA_ID=CAMNT_0006754149 /DNA_START=94 /DNA_END=385 /DNA_ORIENTATION=-
MSAARSAAPAAAAQQPGAPALRPHLAVLYHLAAARAELAHHRRARGEGRGARLGALAEAEQAERPPRPAEEGEYRAHEGLDQLFEPDALGGEDDVGV